MEPLRPETKRFILDANPEAEPTDLEEFERLLSERFTVDPDAPQPMADATPDQPSREERLRQLQRKLFPAARRVALHD